jgi:hypothetical protein
MPASPDRLNLMATCGLFPKRPKYMTTWIRWLTTWE